MGVPSKMLYFPDEGHWVLKPQNSQLWYKTVNDWVDQWDGDEEIATSIANHAMERRASRPSSLAATAVRTEDHLRPTPCNFVCPRETSRLTRAEIGSALCS